MRALSLDSVAVKRDIIIEDSEEAFTGSTPEEVRVSLLALLDRHNVQLSDVFREMDDDGSNLVSDAEFKRTFTDELRFAGTPQVLNQIFRGIDQDHSGTIGFAELQAWTRGKKTKAALKAEKLKTARLEVTGDDIARYGNDWDEVRLHNELKELFDARGLHATDVVRAWAGDDNVMSRSEFCSNLKKLVDDEALWYSQVRGAAFEAFDTIDSADDGSISVVELCQWLDGTVDEHGFAPATLSTTKQIEVETGYYTGVEGVATRMAVRVQTRARGKHYRNAVKGMHTAATKVQARVRGRHDRKEVVERRGRRASREAASPSRDGAAGSGLVRGNTQNLPGSSSLARGNTQNL